MAVDWQALATQADDIINDVLGIDVTIRPWVGATTGGVADPYKFGGGADVGRAVRNIRGCFVSKELASKSFPQMTTEVLQATECFVSIKGSDVGNARKGDHVQVNGLPAPWPNPFNGELIYTTPGDTGRSMLHLIRLKS